MLHGVINAPGREAIHSRLAQRALASVAPPPSLETFGVP